MKTWEQFFEASQVTFQYNRNKFASLPWDWARMMKYRIVNGLFYYARENYIDGNPEPMDDYQFSLITLPNLMQIPPSELSSRNLKTGNYVDQSEFLRMLKDPRSWYDGKIDQIYDGIKMIGATPEYFGGEDIRIPRNRT